MSNEDVEHILINLRNDLMLLYDDNFLGDQTNIDALNIAIDIIGNLD